MTKARRRVVRLALMLKVAGIEPVFVGCNYREMQANLEQQWSGLTPIRRRSARRQALRLISEARGLENAADQLAPRPLQQTTNTGRLTPIHPSFTQALRRYPETARCSVRRMRFGFKRSWPSREIAEQACEQQKDSRLVVYRCPAGAGWHLGHRPDTKPMTSSYRISLRGDKSRFASTHTAPMLPNPLYKEPSMKMQATLGNPLLIMVYSAALLLIGCAVGMHWAHTPAIALRLCIAGGVLIAAHDTATGVLWFWLTTRWARSTIQRNNRG